MNPRIRLQSTIENARQFIVDAESYNENRPEVEPIDCERIREILLMAELAAEQWDRNEIDRSIETMLELSQFASVAT